MGVFEGVFGVRQLIRSAVGTMEADWSDWGAADYENFINAFNDIISDDFTIFSFCPRGSLSTRWTMNIVFNNFFSYLELLSNILSMFLTVFKAEAQVALLIIKNY